MIGNIVGNYKIVEKIGEGGMGAVYKGIDLMLERDVAVKALKPELGSQPLVVERFRAEAVTLAKLNHPNVATLFSFFRQSDQFFMVLEYVKGTTLDKIMEAHGAMTCEEAIPLFCQMLEGIDHAHSLGVVHRDIKPANMMLTESGLLKVLDFGIARALGSARLTRAGHLIGTIEYMSPEQVRGMETDARSDIYSLGMVLYELLTGRVPFASDSEYELMKAQVEQLPTPPSEFAPNIPEQVEAAILCATEKDPERRFQTAGAFSSAIINCVKTAIATGQLSPIDMPRTTARLSATSVVTDLLATQVPRTSMSGAPSSAGVSVETPMFAEAQGLPAPTRIADSVETTVTSPSGARPLVKMTRFAHPTDAQALRIGVPVIPEQALASSSIFAKLNRKHYVAGALSAGVLLLAVAVFALSLFLRYGRQTQKPQAPPTVVESSTDQNPSKAFQEAEPADRGASQPSSDRDASQPSSEGGRNQIYQGNERTRESQDRNPASPQEAAKIKKPGKVNAAPVRNKRRSAKDIMEGRP